MKKHFISVLLFICIFVISINYVNADERKDWLIKKDEQGNLITTADFEIRSLFGNDVINVNNESNETESLYSYIGSDEITYERALGFLNDDQKALINGKKTLENYESVKATIERTYGNETEFVQALGNTKGIQGFTAYTTATDCTDGDNDCLSTSTIDYISLTAYNFVILEETKAPLGMERNKYIVPIEITFYMVLDENNNLSTDNGQIVYNIGSNFIKYNPSVNYTNLVETYTYLVNNWNEIKGTIYTDCEEDINAYIGFVPKTKEADEGRVLNVGGLGSACSHNPVIVDKVGTYDVSVTSYVNNSPSTNAIRHDTVNVKIKLSNNGTVDSYNNVVVSHIPEEVSYVENSASNDGVYDEIDKTITWNVDRLDSSSSIEFTYDVMVPNNAKINSNIIANASLNSDNVTDVIVSNNSTIRVKDIVNPKTGDLEKLGFVIALTIAFAVLYVLHGRNKFINL